MFCGRCCVTEPRSRTALQLDIFIEIPFSSGVSSSWERLERSPLLASRLVEIFCSPPHIVHPPSPLWACLRKLQWNRYLERSASLIGARRLSQQPFPFFPEPRKRHVSVYTRASLKWSVYWP